MRRFEKRFLPSFVGKTAYEELCRRQVVAWAAAGELSFAPEFVGRAWNRKAEIDVAAVNWQDRIVLFGECKWTGTKMNPSHLDDLRVRASLLTEFNGFTRRYALFSKSGFTKALRENPNGVVLVQGGEMARVAE